MDNYNDTEKHTKENKIKLEDNLPPIIQIIESDIDSTDESSSQTNGDSPPLSKGALDDIFDGLAESFGNKSSDKIESVNSMKVEFDHIIDDLNDQLELDHPDLFANERSSLKQRNRYYAFALSALILIITVLSAYLLYNKNTSVSGKRSNVIVSNMADSQLKANYRSGDKEKSSKPRSGVNTPPKLIGVEIVPVMLPSGPTMEAKINASDAEGDHIEYSYEWLLNNEFAGKAPQLTKPFKRGDVVSVTITPYDGYDHGTPIVLQKDIFNTPPQIMGGKSKLKGTKYSYQMETIDYDNDSLTFAISSAPKGMKIDSSGKITWDVPPEYKGSVNISVTITDGNGGKASQQLTLSITDLQTS